MSYKTAFWFAIFIATVAFAFYTWQMLVLLGEVRSCKTFESSVYPMEGGVHKVTEGRFKCSVSTFEDRININCDAKP